MYLERVFRSGVGVGWLPPYALYPPLAPPLPLVSHVSHALHDERDKEIALQRERDRERERERER